MCAHAVGVALKKLDGVERVDVKLNDGIATIFFKSGNHTTLQDVRKVIDDLGFAPGDARAKFTGKINSENGKTWIEVTDARELLVLQLKAESLLSEKGIQEQAGKKITLEGRVAAPEKNSPLKLLLTELRSL